MQMSKTNREKGYYNSSRRDNKRTNRLGPGFVFTFILCFIITDVLDMNNVEEVIVVILIGLIVSSFLLNTNRFLKAIELCKECLFILKDRVCIKHQNLSKSLYIRIYLIMWKCCNGISDNTNARKYEEKLLQMYRESGVTLEDYKLSITLGEIYFHQSRYTQAIQFTEKALLISKEIGDRNIEAFCYGKLGAFYRLVGECEKSLVIHKEIGDRNGEASCYGKLGTVYESVGDYEKAREYHEKSLVIRKEIGDRNGEATCYGCLGTVYESVGDYEKAKEYHEKSLVIRKEIGDRNGEASCYRNLGTVYKSVGEYEKAREHLEKSLVIRKEIGDRNGEASCYGNLGTVYKSVGDYEKAREYHEKSLVIRKEIGDRNGEASCYRNLGTVYKSVGEYEKAREHLEKSLVIAKEIGDRNEEATCYTNLGNVHQSVCEYQKAREYHEKSLVINRDIADRYGEATCYTNIGNMHQSVGEYEKAREYHEKSLVINKEIGDRNGEATCYMSLGNVYQSACAYEKAREYYEKSLVIMNEIGSRNGEANCYSNLGVVYVSVGDYEKASHYEEKSLAISRKTGNKRAIAISYLSMGAKLHSLGKYSKANDYNKKAFAIFTDIGERKGVASFYLNQGRVELAVGNSSKAKEHYENALAISKETGNRATEVDVYLSLGSFFLAQSKYDRAEEYIKEALNLSEEIGNIKGQFHSLNKIAHIRLEEEKIQEAILYFLAGIEKCEDIRDSLHHNDQFKISFSDRNISSYRAVSMLLCKNGNPTEALYVSELSRARALADLMSAQYSLENKISANPRTWAGLEGIIAKESNRTCLYVSYHSEIICLWILKAGRLIHFEMIKGNAIISREGLSQHLDDFFNVRSFGVLPVDRCEDRSQPESKTCEEDNNQGLRIGVESKANQGPKINLPICYKLIIAPVASLLEGPEIIIVPDRDLYQIPFAALTDESGKYLLQTFRFRIVPSLTTLKLINESPADYHCQTGALIVGNPDVGEVYFKGTLRNISRSPGTENEARIVGEKLGVEPFLGQQATKEAVLQAMKSVALIHIAAHGDAERGEIALAPSFSTPNGIPQEEHYLLTMTDISKIQLRAKLVVLSCCHSARGQTKAEGAVGIARAFLGSGARSVLAALWALDESTEQLMTHFYDHLVAGKSAGESLHEAMKWMRSNGYDVNQWAPFILIGDDVVFDFGKKGKKHLLSYFWQRAPGI